MAKKESYINGKPLEAFPISGNERSGELLKKAYLSYGGREVRIAYDLLKRAIEENYTIIFTMSGAMTPADFARSCLNPLIERGIIDILCTTGANLYHDVHRSLGFVLEEGSPFVDDRILRDNRVIRIYDIYFDEEVLLETDRFFQEVMKGEQFQSSMTTSRFHHLLGRYVFELEKKKNISNHSLLATCFENNVPIFCGAPQDGSIYLNVVKLKHDLGDQFKFSIDLAEDVFEYSAYQFWAKKKHTRKMAVVILGGGVPKNYTLQGEPLLGQIFFMDTDGFDIDIQISDANVHTGGLSGCPASEGHTWGKTSAECVINSVYCHSDVTQVFPLIAHALLQEGLHKPHTNLVKKRNEVLELLKTSLAERDNF